MREVNGILTKQGDLQLMNNQIARGEITLQNIERWLVIGKGGIKLQPMAGVGIQEQLLSNTNPIELKQLIRRQLENDGMTVNSIEFSNGQINIDAYYD